MKSYIVEIQYKTDPAFETTVSAGSQALAKVKAIVRARDSGFKGELKGKPKARLISSTTSP